MAITVYRRGVPGPGNLPGYRDTSRDIAAQGGQQLARANMGVAQGVRAVGQGIGQAADVALGIMQQEKMKQDVAVEQDIQAQLTDASGSLFDDPQAGYKAKLGMDAMAQREDTLKAFKNVGTSLRESLKNDTQRAAFDRIWGREWESFNRRVQNHEARQAEIVAAEKYDAVVSALTSDAIRTASTDDHDESRLALLKLEDAAEKRGVAMGLPPEAREAERRRLRTRAMLGIVDNFLESGRDQDAAEYFNAARPDMDEALVTQGNMEARIASANTRIGAVRLAQEAWEKGGDASGALAWLDEQADVDPLVLEGAARRITERRRAEDAARKARDSEPLARLMAGLEQNQRFGDDSDDFRKLSIQGQAKALRERRRYDNRMGLNGPSWQQRQKRANDMFMLRFEQMSPQEQLSMDPEALADQMDASVDAVIKVKRIQARAQGRLAGQALVQASEFSDQLSVRVDQEHPGMKSQEKAALKRWLKGEYSRWRNTEGKDVVPTQDVVDGWVSNWFAKGRKATDPNSWVPEAVQRQPARTRAQAAMKGEGFEPDALPLEPIPQGAPQADNRVTVVGPGGKSFRMENNDDLRKWLEGHPDWKVQ